MRKKVATSRRNIAVSSDLDARMKKLNVNWSQIACDAFRKKMEQLSRKTKKEKIVMIGVERLRNAVDLEKGEMFDEGRNCGLLWASGEAEPYHLRNLKKWLSGVEHDYGNISPSGFYKAIDSNSELGEGEFWKWAVESVSLGNIESDGFLMGFARGALDVWDEV